MSNRHTQTIRKRRKPRLLKCTIINPPANREEQKTYDSLITKTLATALCRCLGPEQIDLIIKQLEQEGV